MTTRRLFLTGSMTAAAAATLGACATSAHSENWDELYDVVIVGAGGAGMSAAAEASKKGLKVIVLEKTPLFGGSSVLCGGSFTLAGTQAQKERGIKDTDEIFFSDMRKVGGNKNDPDLIRAYIANAMTQYLYITDTLGIKPYNIVAGSGMSAKRAHMFKPAQVVGAMKADAEKHGAKIVYSTRVTRLLVNPANNTVEGVQATRRGKTIRVGARLGVILCSGGFARNKALLEKYNPLMARADSEGGIGNTGDGTLMAMALGAEMLDTNYIKATHGYRPTDPSLKRTCHTYYYGGVLVNQAGKRFVNEQISYKLLGDASLTLKNGISYAVFDEPIRQAVAKDMPKGGNFMAQLDGGKDTTWCFQGRTIEEVAKKAGVDPKGLAATIRKYNEDVKKSGKDSAFGRDSLTSGYGKLRPIDKAPFFIYPVKPRLIATYCGVRINPQAQVINVFGEPIKGLYAAGEVTGGLHGAAYMSGTAWGKAMTFGRIAADVLASKK